VTKLRNNEAPDQVIIDHAASLPAVNTSRFAAQTATQTPAEITSVSHTWVPARNFVLECEWPIRTLASKWPGKCICRGFGGVEGRQAGQRGVEECKAQAGSEFSGLSFGE